MQFIFGPGSLIATPLTDAFGTPISPGTPRQLGAFQEASFDSSAENKMLYGPNQYPIAVGRGKAKANLKIKAAQISVDKWNALYVGQPANQTAGVAAAFIDTIGTAVPTTPYQITPATAYASYLAGTTPVFAYDLGVQDGAGNALKCVTASPATGQYAVNTSTGVYTFAAADTGIVYFISFAYSATGSGNTAKAAYVNVANIAMGQAPFMQIDLVASYAGMPFKLTLWSAIATKISFATKLDDFAIPDLEFDGFAATSGANSGKIFLIGAGQ